MARRRIGLREVRSLKPGEIVWDAAVAGFAARRQRGDAVAYVLKYRTAEGRQRWHTIGRHGAPWTPDKAREEAQRLLGEVAKHRDPAAEKKARRTGATVAELCDTYFAATLAGRVLKRSGAAKKPSTLAIDKGRIERHIKPLLGTHAVAAVTRHDVERFLHDIAEGRTRAQVKTKARGLARVTGGKTAANRSVGLLGAIFTFAVRLGLRPDNPVHGSQRFADARRERRLSDAEYAALGEALGPGRGSPHLAGRRRGDPFPGRYWLATRRGARASPDRYRPCTAYRDPRRHEERPFAPPALACRV